MPDERWSEACERELPHRCGAIQPHGVLLRLDADGRIGAVSANAGALLGGEPAGWLGAPLPEWLAPLPLPAAQAGTRLVHPYVSGPAARPFDVVAVRSPDQEVLFEIMPAADPGEAGLVPPAAARLPPVPDDEEGLAAACADLIARIAERTGFERVMYYRFRDDGDGEVVAEVRQPGVHGTYLGLRFPAGDIPRIARDLYLKNPWRLIPDAQAEPVAVVARNAAAGDLTYSDLRAVSPVHRVYLGNMGVRASLSFPVATGGILKALVACHHATPRYLSPIRLEHAASLVRRHAFVCGSFRAQQRIRLLDSVSRRFDSVRAMLGRAGGIVSAWDEVAPWLIREFAADGACLVFGEHRLGYGTAFEEAPLQCVDSWFTGSQGELVRVLDSLVRAVPAYPLSEVAGAVCLRFAIGGIRGGGRLYLTRGEHIHDVAWGGNPEKPVEYHDGTLGIAPRRSFEKWVERRLGYCRPWGNESMLHALHLRQLLDGCSLS